MTQDSERPSVAVSRRKMILATGAAGVASLAGCLGGDEGTGSADDSGTAPLTADGSSTVYPITSRGGSLWNGNAPASDEEYWGPSQYGIETDKAMADYWAGLYGFEAKGSGDPPFKVSVGLSHSGVGLTKVKNGQVDIGDASAPVEAELEDVDYDKFVNHVVGVDAQPIVVSKEVYDAGVTKLTAEQVREIYRGTITDWSEIDRYSGPEKEIQAVGRSEGSGTDTAFKANMLGDVNATMDGIDIRKGQNQQVAGIIRNSNNAIAYMALAFVDDTVQAIELEFEGRTYTPGENLADKSYPLSRDLHCYTHEGTSRKEAAFLRMVIHDFGQGNFVETAGYATLTDDRQQNQLDKLSDE